MAVVVAEPAEIKKIAAANGLPTENYEELLKNKKVRDTVIEMLNKTASEFKLNGLERVKKVYLSPIQFNTENDLATPTMKVKRYNVKKYFEKELQDLYEE